LVFAVDSHIEHSQRLRNYPPQVNAPGLQLLALELAELDELAEPIVKDATFDIIFFVFALSHFGHAGSLSDSEKRRFTSNSSPHFVQRNSYNGMIDSPYKRDNHLKSDCHPVYLFTLYPRRFQNRR
jgi:hypothetical protein